MDRNQKDDTEFQEIDESYEDSMLDIEKNEVRFDDPSYSESSIYKNLPIYIISFLITLSGLSAIVQPLATRLTNHPGLFKLLNIYDYYHWTKMLSVGFGLFLILLAFNLLKRKKVAFELAFYSCLLSAGIHLLRYGQEYIVWLKNNELSQVLPAIITSAPILTVILLWLARNRFTVRSEKDDLANGVYLLLVSIPVLIIYATLGFWFLEVRDFGINFQFYDSMTRAIRELLFLGNDDIIPRSRFARWFLDSINILESGTFIYVAFSLFKPINYRLNTKIKEKELASSLLDSYGTDSLDTYKLLDDKSYFFDQSKTAFVAYKAVMNVAICLGDPVGEEKKLEPLLKSFKRYCHDNDWKVAFLQVKQDNLDLFREQGFHVLKVGEDAIVDLDKFAEKTIKSKSFKQALKKLEKENFKLNRYMPPHSEATLAKAEEISNQWLSLPGRQERGFSLGWFDKEALKDNNLYILESEEEGAIAFVNQVRSYAKGEVSIDMMRHKVTVPNGTMDFLFCKLLVNLKENGFHRFSLGLAALSGVGDKANATKEEKAVHLIYEHMNRFFSYKGLRRYKSKFDPSWEERFLIYEGSTTGLIKTALAIARAGKIEQ